MPVFHFHLVGDDAPELIGSLDLPGKGAVIPAGLKLATRVLAGAVRRDVRCDGFVVRATDDDGDLVYSFAVAHSKDKAGRLGYLH